MAEEIKAANPAEAKTPVAGKRRAKKSKAGKKKAVRAAKKAAKKSVAKKRSKAKTPAKGRKKAKRIIAPESPPTILVVGAGSKAEPVWLKYAAMSPQKPSKRPSIPTDIRVGNLVGWRTDSGKDRIGVVQEFVGDAARVGMGGKTELIRVARLTKLAEKVKQE